MSATCLDFLLLPKPVVSAFRCDQCEALIGNFQKHNGHVVHLDLAARPESMCIADFVAVSVERRRPSHARAA